MDVKTITLIVLIIIAIGFYIANAIEENKKIKQYEKEVNERLKKETDKQTEIYEYTNVENILRKYKND